MSELQHAAGDGEKTQTPEERFAQRILNLTDPTRREDVIEIQNDAPPPTEEIQVPYAGVGIATDADSLATSTPQALAELIQEHRLCSLSDEVLLQRLESISESLILLQEQQFETFARQRSTSEPEMVSSLTTGSSSSSSGRKRADPIADCAAAPAAKLAPDPPSVMILMEEKLQTSTGSDWIIEHLSKPSRMLNKHECTRIPDPPEDPDCGLTKDPPSANDISQQAVTKGGGALESGYVADTEEERKPAAISDGGDVPSADAETTARNGKELARASHNGISGDIHAQPAFQRGTLRMQGRLEKAEARTSHDDNRDNSDDLAAAVQPGAMRVSGVTDPDDDSTEEETPITQAAQGSENERSFERLWNRARHEVERIQEENSVMAALDMTYQEHVGRIQQLRERDQLQGESDSHDHGRAVSRPQPQISGLPEGVLVEECVMDQEAQLAELREAVSDLQLQFNQPVRADAVIVSDKMAWAGCCIIS